MKKQIYKDKKGESTEADEVLQFVKALFQNLDDPCESAALRSAEILKAIVPYMAQYESLSSTKN